MSFSFYFYQDQIQKDTFYDLESALDAYPKIDSKFVIGDFNVKIGKENIYRGTIGNH